MMMMQSNSTPVIVARDCPYCQGPAAGSAFPWKTHYGGKKFCYYRCSDCNTVYIDPVPDDEIFDRMYAKSDYHEAYYNDSDPVHYNETATMLAKHLPSGARIIDYGCGVGDFLLAARAQGLKGGGVEYDVQAARFAEQRTGFPVITTAAFEHGERPNGFGEEPIDCLHMGDTIEHLPYPVDVVRQLTGSIRPGGLFSIEGPLERQFSLVNIAARLVGWIKYRLLRRDPDNFAPYHLLFVDAESQRRFFKRIDSTLELLEWEIYETGWPYRDNGAVRDLIARASIALSKMPGLAKVGNRFRAIYRKGSDSAPVTNAS